MTIKKKIIIISVVATAVIVATLLITFAILVNNGSDNASSSSPDSVLSDETENAPLDENGVPVSSSKLTEYVEMNEDTAAWLTINDTNIDYPVMFDGNDSYYLVHTPERVYSGGGSIFLSSINTGEWSESCFLLHGHYMGDGTMFNDVSKFRDKDFFDTHVSGTLETQDATYSLTLFAYIHATIHLDIYTRTFINEPVKDEVAYIKDNAAIYDEPDISDDSHVVLLSTCDGLQETDYRHVAVFMATPK